jgi:hypothetical protein
MKKTEEFKGLFFCWSLQGEKIVVTDTVEITEDLERPGKKVCLAFAKIRDDYMVSVMYTKNISGPARYLSELRSGVSASPRIPVFDPDMMSTLESLGLTPETYTALVEQAARLVGIA